MRESSLGATAFVPGEPDTWPGWEDSACPPEKMGDYLRDLRKLFNKYGYNPSLYGHFGQGCIHCRVPFELTTHKGLETYRAFMNEAVDLVIRYGGSLSGEHGDGQARGEFLPRMYGEELYRAFQEFKAIWDPDNKMNPGKVVDAYKITDNLRLGVDYNPPQLDTHFKYPVRQGHVRACHAALRGRGQVPARGRRHDVPLLHGDAGGETLHAGPRPHAVRDDGGRGDNGRLEERGGEGRARPVPVVQGLQGGLPGQCGHGDVQSRVPVALLRGRLRPRHAYAFGLIHWWARLGGLIPGVVNLFTHAPFVSRIMKAAAGIAPQREAPAFAPYTFKSWFAAREGANGNGEQGRARLIATSHAQRDLPPDPNAPRSRNYGMYDVPAANQPSATRTNRVILWPDTFNDHFHPTTAQAAVEVLEAAGCQVVVPMQDMCCGRPLYDYGMLDEAKKWLHAHHGHAQRRD